MRGRLDATVLSKETAYAKREVLVNFTERREMRELILRFRGWLTDRHEISGRLTLEQLLSESHEGEQQSPSLNGT
jgi:hypothetical protein